MLSLQKKLSPPPHPNFLFEISVISVAGITLTGEGVHVKRTGTKDGGEGGQKLEVSSKRTF